MLNKKILVIGAGNMGEALIKGILKARLAEKDMIFASDIDKERLSYIRKEVGIEVFERNKEAIERIPPDVVILAVKPYQVEEVLNEVDKLITSRILIISIAAGITTRSIEEKLREKIPVIRGMPNAPALIGKGVSGITFGKWVELQDKEVAEAIFSAIGDVVVVEEDLMDAVTGLSGSSPGFVFMIIEALTDAGVALGLSREIALRLSCKTVEGSARMVLETGYHPAILKDKVTSPAGTTIAGIYILEKKGLRASLMEAVVSSAKKSHELRKE
ncbi:MAG: pyrroline-5-carboxylate reductase [bacterium]|nr:pyrroline-5-carboxylate reductase [bacterium]